MASKRGFARFQILANSWDSANFSDFAGITVHDYLESLLRTCWEKKLLLRAFWEKVPTLREIKTLGGGGYIVKIETSVAELKIALNFRGG
jgi:hypothetical protein